MTRRAWCALLFSAACGGGAATPDAGAPDAGEPSGLHVRAGYHLPGVTGARDAMQLSIGPSGVAIAGGFVQAGRAPGAPAAFANGAWTSLAQERMGHVIYDGGGALWGAQNGVDCTLGFVGHDTCPGPALFQWADGAWQARALPADVVFGPVAPLTDGFVSAGYDVVRITSTGVEELDPGAGNVFAGVATRGDRICVTSRLNHGTTYTNSVRCYDDGAWVQQGPVFPDGLVDAPRAIAFLGDGTLAVATERGVYELAGGAWTELAGAPTGVFALAADGQTLYAGGGSLARYAGGAWTAIDVQSQRGDVRIDDLQSQDGAVYAAGNFDLVEGRVASGVARLGGGALVDPGDHPLGTAGDIHALLADPAGAIAGGNLIAVGETPVAYAAQLRADGWHALGDPGAAITALVRTADDRVVAGTVTGAVLTWDGTAWQTFAPARDGAIEALLVDGNDLLAAGQFPGGFARWNGSAWTGAGFVATGAGYALGRDADGRICAGMLADAPRHPLWCVVDGAWSVQPGVVGAVVYGIYPVDHALIVQGVLDQGPLQSTAGGIWEAPHTAAPLPYGASPMAASLLVEWSGGDPDVYSTGVRALLDDGATLTFAAPSYTEAPPFAQGFGVADL